MSQRLILFFTRKCRTCRRRRKGIINSRGEFLCQQCALTFLNLFYQKGPRRHQVDLKRLIESN